MGAGERIKGVKQGTWIGRREGVGEGGRWVGRQRREEVRGRAWAETKDVEKRGKRIE